LADGLVKGRLREIDEVEIEVEVEIEEMIKETTGESAPFSR
jgi:hypothetical protein